MPDINTQTEAKHPPPVTVDPSKPDTIPKFADALPIPEKAIPLRICGGTACYRIEMKEGLHRFHKDFPKTMIWGYNGTYPGPTIHTIKGQPVCVKWANNLPRKHFLPVDKTLHGAIENPEVRSVVHLHGADVAPGSDGYPEAWYTKDYRVKGPRFKRRIYKYPNTQQATTLWYHDHAIGITRLNVYAGLAGFYLLHDWMERRLNLPRGEYDIPMMIQDKTFNADGSLYYPDKPLPPFPPTDVYPSVVPAFIGNTILVNGKVWPYLPVQPRKYRFRILNASNTVAYTIQMSNGQSFWQIGTDGGFISSPVELKSFILEPAERIDLIIDFTSQKGKEITLTNESPNPNTSVIMQFKVNLPLKGEDTSVIPEELEPVEELNQEMVKKTRTNFLDASTDMYGRPMLMLNDMMWNDPATEIPEYDSIEIWEIANLTPFPHPIHLHLVQFQILDRRPFDVAYFRETRQIRYFDDKPAEPPLPYEKGWKDVVRAEAGKVTRIIAHFKNHTGDYVWHCHILEHEDHDMMRPLRVIKPYSG